MEETINTIPLDAENEKILSVWVGRGPQMQRIQGRIDHVIIVTHEFGTDPANWQLTVPTGASVEALIPALIESLKRYCDERNLATAPKPRPAVQPQSRTDVIPFPKGMTPAQIEEFSQNIKKAKLGQGGPPKNWPGETPK